MQFINLLHDAGLAEVITVVQGSHDVSPAFSHEQQR
jgi:hypothetical protein